MKDEINIKGARKHNLKGIDVKIPKNKLVVFTGVSGSGKSSLAFDTIYAEGQRRYVESLATYARQFLGLMEKPPVDVIEGLSPAISIDQKTTSKNPRSTVGTVTEVYDYFRLLFARIGHPHCPVCGREIARQSLDQIVDGVLSLIKKVAKGKRVARFIILAPIVSDKKGEFQSLFENLKAKGFKYVRVDGQVRSLSEDFVLIKTNKHTIEAVVDRVSLSVKSLKDKVSLQNLKSRISDSIEQALSLTDGLVVVSQIKDAGFEMPEFPKKLDDHLFSEKFACPVDNIQLPEIEPRTFSFNSPHGACPECSGIGKILKVVPDLVLSETLSIKEGGILPFGTMFEKDTWYSRVMLKVCKEHKIDPTKPIEELTEDQKDLILRGTGERVYRVSGTNRRGQMTQIYETFEGIINELERRHSETDSDYVRGEIEKYMRKKTCPDCKGARLKKEALSVTIDAKAIAEITALAINDCLSWVKGIMIKKGLLSKREKEIAKMIVREIKTRLEFLSAVGLNYLTLDRPSGTLSGGEAQRIRLASQIGSGLTGVLYVLDEPTIGLHPRDNYRLIETLKHLRDIGNTVIVVEHDREMIASSDHILDFGPGAGKFGGAIVAEGKVDKIRKNKDSLTGKYLAGKKKIRVRNGQENLLEEKKLEIKGCNKFNLKEIDVSFPLGKLVVITGVSGSGKSTLLVDTLFHALKKTQNPRYKEDSQNYSSLVGAGKVDKVVLIDQSPIGRTPRSNPATYTKVFDDIREVFASTRESKARGYKKGRFSFNVKSGRCEACEGQGQNKIEMQFMSDIWVECDVCKGKRYSQQTLEVEYKGKNIADVLEMTVSEAKEFFHAHPKIVKRLQTIEDVGLGYIELGQPATTLSGGEAQRVKLSSELSKRSRGNTVYILDEPTTGLHFADLQKLLSVLRKLVDKGNSVFLIEHNLDVVKNADWIIDLGPEGGEEGGEVVAEGGVRKIVKNKKSYTGQYLKKVV